MSEDVSITVPAELADRIEQRVASGAAADAAEVVRAGLASLDAEDARKLAAVREKIAEALRDPQPSSPADAVFERIEALIGRVDRA